MMGLSGHIMGWFMTVFGFTICIRAVENLVCMSGMITYI